MKPRISVIGTGRMGSALVKTFLKQGYPVDIWNRTKSRSEPLAALGARIAATVQHAIASAEIVVVNQQIHAVKQNSLLSGDRR
jgi:3-hydroxyisobutyrate dehydrogenase-like beta-hydroxyacid dehydrogenase